MIKWVDRCARLGLLVGVVMMLQPWWQHGFRFGFFATAFFTLLHIVSSKVRVV